VIQSVHPPDRYSRRGLSLLETLLAAVLFAIATLAVGALFRAAELSTLRNSQRQCAESFVSQLIEETIDDGQAGIVPKEETGAYTARTVRRGAETVTSYDFEVTVDDLPAGVRDVLVTVSWSHGEQRMSVTREVLVCPAP
jgi:Tfp pilus assembly protein PilV